MKKLFLAFAVVAMQLYFSQELTGLKGGEQKKTELTSELSGEQTESYNTRFFKFIEALKSSDRKTIDGMLSDKVKTVVTDDVLKKLTESVDFSRKMDVFKTGYRSLIDGGNYPTVQYKYSDDRSELPKEIITVIFEDNGQILGIKPDQTQ